MHWCYLYDRNNILRGKTPEEWEQSKLDGKEASWNEGLNKTESLEYIAYDDAFSLLLLTFFTIGTVFNAGLDA